LGEENRIRKLRFGEPLKVGSMMTEPSQAYTATGARIAGCGS
jgi:hypothetical protein